MNSIIEILTSISTPLILSGVIFVLLSWLFKSIIQKSPTWTKKDSLEIISKIINVMGFLALASMILGTIGYIFTYFLSENIRYKEKEIRNEVVYITATKAAVRKEPTHTSNIIYSLGCGEEVRISESTWDRGYLKYKGGYIEKSQIVLKQNVSEDLCAPSGQKIKANFLYGTWLSFSKERKDIKKFTFHKSASQDSTILYDGLYNGTHLAYKSIGGEYVQRIDMTPITWDILSEGKIIAIDLWTEVNDKGFRQKWELEWQIIEISESIISFKQRILGLDSSKKKTLVRCSSKSLQKTLKGLCENNLSIK